jgi:signal transduction histidine kinase
VSDAERIFEPGVQTAGGSGVGLGLALSRRLARSVGGDVTADSAAGGGGRLVVELPTVARGAT